MSKRWYGWLGGGLFLVLLGIVVWRVSQEIPAILRKAEGELAATAARSGLEVRHGGLKLHLLHLYLSLDNVVVRDALDDVALARAGAVEVSLSPLRLLRGELPVSRVRIRDFLFEAGDRNRELYRKLSAGEKGTPGGSLPEILLVNGSVRLGPIGPVRRFEASVQELRIREARFLGTRITAFLSRVNGQFAGIGVGDASWPYPSLEAELVYKGDVLRVRRARAWGGPSEVRLSGIVDMRRRTADWSASGGVDVRGWIAAGAPMADYAGKVVRTGKLEFSASASGPWENPKGGIRISLRGASSRWGSPLECEAGARVEDRVILVDKVRGRVAGGSLDAAGRLSARDGSFEGKASLTRVALAAVPWKELGVGARLTGTADAAAELSGTAGRWKGALSLTLPEGFRSAPPGNGNGEGVAVRLPLAGNVIVVADGNDAVRIETVRLQAGQGEVRGEGAASLKSRTVVLRGSLKVPAGSVAEYGWNYPLAWAGLTGEWELSGPVEHLRTKASLVASRLTARALPPVPVTVKIDGTPADTLHFAADIPATAFRATAVGTLTAPLDPARAGEISIAIREIDLADGGKWASAVAASLGEDPGPFRGYFEGAKGTGTADARIRLSPGSLAVSASVGFPEMLVQGIPLRSVKAQGEVGGSEGRWSARAEALLGGGTVRAEAKGTAGRDSEVDAEIRGLEIPQGLSLLKRTAPGGLQGKLDASLAVRQAARGWEIPRASATVRGLTFGAVRIAEVRAEGNLGPASGRFSVEAPSPRLALSGEIRRGDGWPATFSLTTAGVPTSFLLAAAGRPETASTGDWSVEADGSVRLADLAGRDPIGPDAIPSLHVSVKGDAPSVGEAKFREIRLTGERKGEALVGAVATEAPETRLSWRLSLREPFGFAVEGPFSFAEGQGGSVSAAAGKPQLALQGRVQIRGDLRAMDRTVGTIRLDSLAYREGGFDLSARDVQARMDPEGFHWVGGTVQAAGSPVRIAGKVSWDRKLDLRLAGKLPAGAVRLAVPGVFDRLDGVVTIELRVTGSVDDPVLVGTGHLEGGTLSFLGYAQQFEQMKADAVLSREKIVFEHFEGRSGGGYVDGWGEVPLETDGGQRLYFSVDFLNMRYPYPEEIRPVVQGHAELFGPVDDLVVTGDVEVQSARYTRTMYPERALLDFRRRLSDVAARREKSEFRVRLDINVTADRTLRIKNNLADIWASGDFKVQGDSGKVIVLGVFDVDEGYVEFYGNRYDLRRVTVDFQDPRRNNPRLDVRAETKKSGYNVTVMVSGTLDKPEVDFSSDPPLSQTDIVSLLSFGVTTQALATPGTKPSSGTGAVGGAAIAIGSLGGVDEKIRGGLGLDKFSIETGFSQTTQAFEPRFVMRKSFEDRATMSVSTSIGTSSETTAEGEVRLLEHLYLQGGWQSSITSTQGEVSGDLIWRYRFQSFKDLLHGEE